MGRRPQGDFNRAKLESDIVEFNGAVEIAPSLGRSDLICDLVSTGATMAADKIREGD